MRDQYVWKEGDVWYMIIGFGIEPVSYTHLKSGHSQDFSLSPAGPKSLVQVQLFKSGEV